MVGADRPVGRLDVVELVDAVDRRGAAGGERGPGDRRDHRLGRPERRRRPTAARARRGWAGAPARTRDRSTDIVPPSRPRNKTRDAEAGMGGCLRSPRPSPPIPRRTTANPGGPGRPRTSDGTGRRDRRQATPSADPGQSRVFRQAAWQTLPILGLIPTHDGSGTVPSSDACGSPGQLDPRGRRPMTARTLSAPRRRWISLLAGLLPAPGAGARAWATAMPRRRSPNTACIDPNQPRELQMVSMPPYVVEPPDELEVSVRPAVPDLTLTTVTVQTDGNIDLGFVGDVYVAGLTLEQIEQKIAQHLTRHGRAETGRAGPTRSRSGWSTAAQSKSYYVLGTVTTQGKFPITGNETVLDAHPRRGPPFEQPPREGLPRPSPPRGRPRPDPQDRLVRDQGPGRHPDQLPALPRRPDHRPGRQAARPAEHAPRRRLNLVDDLQPAAPKAAGSSRRRLGHSTEPSRSDRTGRPGDSGTGRVATGGDAGPGPGDQGVVMGVAVEAGRTTEFPRR